MLLAVAQVARDAFDDGDVVLGPPSRTADEQTVYMRLAGEVEAVAGIDAAAIKHLQRLRPVSPSLLLDEGMLLVGETGGSRRSALADGPYGLVGEDDFLEPPGGYSRQGRADLPREDRSGSPGLIVLAGIADADEREESMPDGGLGLHGDHLVRLAEMGATLAVAYLDEARAHIPEHGGRDLPGIGALVGPVHVLGTDDDPRAFQNARDVGDRREGRDDERANARARRDVRSLERLRERAGLRPRLVHLPVRADPGNLRHARPFRREGRRGRHPRSGASSRRTRGSSG